MPKWHAGAPDMSDRETATRLVMQSDSHGYFAVFVGVAPFYFMKKLGLFNVYELVEGDPSRLSCITGLRIFNYQALAPSEVGCMVTPEGKIADVKGKIREPEKLLSTKAAPAGWEIHCLVPRYGEIVASWLEQNPEQ